MGTFSTDSPKTLQTWNAILNGCACCTMDGCGTLTVEHMWGTASVSPRYWPFGNQPPGVPFCPGTEWSNDIWGYVVSGYYLPYAYSQYGDSVGGGDPWYGQVGYTFEGMNSTTALQLNGDPGNLYNSETVTDEQSTLVDLNPPEFYEPGYEEDPNRGPEWSASHPSVLTNRLTQRLNGLQLDKTDPDAKYILTDWGGNFGILDRGARNTRYTIDRGGGGNDLYFDNYRSKAAYRWVIPEENTRQFLKVTWDIVYEPDGWAWHETNPGGDPQYFRTLLESKEWIVPAGTGRRVSDWYDLLPVPGKNGQVKVYNLCMSCYGGPFGEPEDCPNGDIEFPPAPAPVQRGALHFNNPQNNQNVPLL